MKKKIVARMRQHRDTVAFNRAIEEASGSMRQELLAMATHQGR